MLTLGDLVTGVESLADLISDYDPLEKQKQLLNERLPDTCEWIEHQPEYSKWCAGEGPPALICTGSGKSTCES